MNILFLAPRLPLPADTGGKIRTLNILKQLAAAHRVTLLCFSFESQDQSLALQLKDMGIEVELIEMPAIAVWRKVVAVLFSSLPFSIAKYDVPSMRQAIAAVLSKNKIDAIHVDHLHMAVYHDCLKGIPSFLDEHNVEYKILERCADVEKSILKKMIYVNQAFKMRAIEASMAKRFNGVFACSLDDKNLLNELIGTGVSVYVIPNGVDVAYFKNNHAAVLEEAIVFTGSMDWLPNDDAITFFCRDILPLIWQKNDRISLYVVGKNPSVAVKELAARDPRVKVTGRVDDVRPFIEKAKLFIVPLRIGGGTRLKILEAMAMQKAIVSTRIGAEGIDCSDGKDIALADMPAHFAQQVIDLIADEGRISQMGNAGMTLVKSVYDWPIIGKTLNNIYSGVVHAKK